MRSWVKGNEVLILFLGGLGRGIGAEQGESDGTAEST